MLPVAFGHVLTRVRCMGKEALCLDFTAWVCGKTMAIFGLQAHSYTPRTGPNMHLPIHQMGQEEKMEQERKHTWPKPLLPADSKPAPHLWSPGRIGPPDSLCLVGGNGNLGDGGYQLVGWWAW